MKEQRSIEPGYQLILDCMTPEQQECELSASRVWKNSSGNAFGFFTVRNAG